MKKFLFLTILTCVFISCSSDGSREIQIDEVQFVPYYDHHKIEDYSKVSSIFEIVPGKYTISWRLVDDVPQQQNYNVELKLKLRLKKTVKIHPKVYETLGNFNEEKIGCDKVDSPFGFYLVNANGIPEKIIVSKLSIDNNPLEDWRKHSMYNKDQMMDFINFLASKPGSEIDIVCNNIGTKNAGGDCTEIIKDARGIQCAMNDEDETFEKHIGIIE